MSSINPVAGSSQSQAGQAGVIGEFPLRAVGLSSETKIDWRIPHPTEIGTVVGGELLSGERFLEALRVEPLLDKVMIGTLSTLKAIGVELTKAEQSDLMSALDEVLSNAIIHGVLGVGSRERMTDIRKLGVDLLADELRTLKLSSQQPTVRVEIKADAHRLELSIIDSGALTPERVATLRAARKADLAAFDELIERKLSGGNLSESEEAIFDRVINQTNGRGFDLAERFFPVIEGLHGGVRLTRPLNADASS
jgi:anti-sigma regulatory factor (Ser/Thr protein kinase)